jgi:mono/diheme cytochrome c family protein
MKNTRLRTIGLTLLAVLMLSFLWAARIRAQEDNGDKQQLGAQIYADNCAVCHGADGEGRIGAVLAKDWPSIRPDLASREAIAKGVPGSVMPAWSQENGGPLTDEEINAVVSYILSWQTGGAPAYTPAATATSFPEISPIPEIEGDPNQGAVLYEENCTVCHGAQGEGRIGATLAKEWPAIRPDLTISSTIASGIEGTTMPAWSQAFGGPLSQEDINDIVAYILSWQPPAEITPPTTPAAPTETWLAGPGGVLLFIALFILLIAVILLAQRGRQGSSS